jgi:predicted small lipoprotein YifL
MKRLSILLAATTLGVGLAGCGLKGDLETPAPLWGDPQRAAAVDRELPNAASAESDRIIFTRDDVNLFQDDAEEEDPFAEDDVEAPASDGAEGGAPLPPTAE